MDQLSSLQLSEKFISAIVSDHARPAVSMFFTNVRINTAASIMDALQGVMDRHFKGKEGTPEYNAAINGLLVGTALTWGLQCSGQFEEYMREWTQLREKARGDNIVDFFQQKANRRT